MRDMARRHSNWRSDNDLDSMLKAQKLPGVAGLDTRRLTRLLRDSGSLRGAFGTADQGALLAAARNEKGTSGVDLVSQVTTPKPYTVGDGKFAVVAYDFGIKTTILRCLSEMATVTVVPAHTTAEEVLAMSPNGVFLSNGPGDPEMVPGATAAIRALVEAGTPTFGICLGHQLLSRAFGGHTFKLPFGHHGANHPVRHIATGTVEITSQNHNFCVDPDSLSGIADITHINLNDNTNEGMRLRDLRAFSVQYHPEAGPGPHDSRYLFGQFAELMEKN
jgi:carbamoyl-phosphate synthase small subunit